MLGIMLRKVWNKKWFSICQLVGVIFLVATVVSFPMYQTAIFNRMLTDEFDLAYSRTGEWPAVNSLSYTARREAEGETIKKIESYVENLHGQLGVTQKEILFYYVTGKMDAYSQLNRDDVDVLPLRLSFLSDMQDHISILAGTMYSDTGISPDGYVEALISQECMINSALLLGETIEFPTLHNPEGETLRIRIVGVFDAKDKKDLYWQVSPDELTNNCMIREEIYREYFIGEQSKDMTLVVNYYPMWEYGDLKAGDVPRLYKETKYMLERGPYSKYFEEAGYVSVLEDYMRKKSRIEAVLFLLQVPVWILLGAFLFMISTQVYDIERNEISVTKSRGGSGVQIFLLYFYQSIFIAALGAACGLPLGGVFARLLGATDSFLEWNLDRRLEVAVTLDTIWYLLAAMAGCILIMALPAVRHSRLSIVHLKHEKATVKWSWWEVCFLDVILLGIGLYGYFTYAQKETEIAESALMGARMDPLLYISSSLFIVGAGLLLVRLQPLIVRLLYFVGRVIWGPAAYISFMENRKNGRKQQFIILFLIISISLGMYHSTAARTILQNAKENVSYLDGADIIVKEVWSNNSSISYEGISARLEYYEPDFDKYASFPGAASYTRVVYDEASRISSGKGSMQAITLMGIHTFQFGQITSLPRRLLEKQYNEYLNELAASPKGALVSRNFCEILGYEIGDKINIVNGDNQSVTCDILDFFDYWPGYMSSTIELNPNGSTDTVPKYLVVANIAQLTKGWGKVPYEVWISMQEENVHNTSQWFQEQNVRLEKFVDRNADIEAVAEDPLLQGTNGILTIGFLITMLLCSVGYLIYWILSIKSRELIFGVLRAEGMHRGEIYCLLLLEQLFCGGFAILSGTLVGIFSSRMFVPILQVAYAASNQALPMHLITRQQDMIKLYSIIGVLLLVSLGILMAMVRRLNVAKALKLGEE